MNKPEYRLFLAMLGLIIDIKTQQILITRMLSSDAWRGDKKTRQQLKDSLAREESQLEQAEHLLKQLKDSASE